MSQQGLRQSSFRAIGGTTGSLNEDMLAAFAAEAVIPAGASFNGAFILWLQARLSSADDSLPGLMQAFAEANGAHNWSSLGSFDPAAEELIVSVAASADDATEVISTGVVTVTDDHERFRDINLTGIRFLPAIAQGTPLISATLRMVVSITSSSQGAATVHGEDVDDAAQYTTAANNISSRTTTTASSTLAIVGSNAGKIVEFLVTDPVQEIVNRAGWVSGNGLGLVISSTIGGGRFYAAQDHATFDPPTLILRFAA